MSGLFSRPLRLILTASAILAATTAQAQTFSGSAGMRQQSTPDQPKAQLRIYGSNDVMSNWSGSGRNIISTDLCAASSTGRFRLHIQSAGGGRMTSIGSPDRMAYTVRFRDGAGLEQSRRVNGDALVTFEGSSPDAGDCSRGANALIEIDLAEADMLSRAAGRYFDQLVITVDPI
ncbi:MAG TPA: hypothetical protein VF503_32585 [Sphingobium sp.]|uniref:hypothetical protein n=1 Tax=Sphingobium sp. TaxID=1912891 RepID=UPI002ED18D96